MTDSIRIAHYNILEGGEGRLDIISKAITQMDVGICGILEANGWEKDEGHYRNYAKRIGYDFFRVASANSEYNLAVFARFPLSVIAITEGIRHVVLQATIESGPFAGLTIFFVHLSPVSEDARLLELESIHKHISNFPSSIIMGDLNSLSPHDPYERETLLADFHKKKIVKYGTDALRFDVINQIEASGLEDAMRFLNRPFVTTVPTLFNTDINHAVSLRIDYAFLTQSCLKKLFSADIIKNDITNMASDHYPLVIELRA